MDEVVGEGRKSEQAPGISLDSGVIFKTTSKDKRRFWGEREGICKAAHSDVPPNECKQQKVKRLCLLGAFSLFLRVLEVGKTQSCLSLAVFQTLPAHGAAEPTLGIFQQRVGAQMGCRS